jgi:hypothetical protein
MELLAVITVLMIIPKYKSVQIYTDSNNVITKFNAQKSLSFRKKFKENNFLLWELLECIIQELQIKITFHKVRAHTGDFWNDQADNLAKEGRNLCSIFEHNNYSKYKGILQWYGHNIDTNSRNFIKKINQTRIDINLSRLNRLQDDNKAISSTLKNIDTVTSKEGLNTQYIKKVDREKYNDKPRKFVNLKVDREKSFKIKKMFNELPTMENLKKRFPKLYPTLSMCPRCEDKPEDIIHLWECRKADNDMLFVQNRAKERLQKLLYYNSEKFKDIDSLMTSLFPFFRTKKNLNRYNESSSKFYSNIPEKKNKLDYTYVWDGKNCLDNLLRGWIPKDLSDIIISNMKMQSKKFVNNLILKWLGKINSLFFDLIWVKRNEDMINWEKEHNISKQDKKKKRSNEKAHKSIKDFSNKSNVSKSRKNNRENQKRSKSGKKKNTVHYIDEILYNSIRKLVFGYNFKFTLE